nr:aromatic amine dehydrogenase beta subunit, AADH beta {N-terminal} [Alcaligenes faecalis, IFO 14479, Peptide Partial, 17 aa] [Alcaligenes faecalis]
AGGGGSSSGADHIILNP